MIFHFTAHFFVCLFVLRIFHFYFIFYCCNFEEVLLFFFYEFSFSYIVIKFHILDNYLYTHDIIVTRDQSKLHRDNQLSVFLFGSEARNWWLPFGGLLVSYWFNFGNEWLYEIHFLFFKFKNHIEKWQLPFFSPFSLWYHWQVWRKPLQR